jgi:hypothetical protein
LSPSSCYEMEMFELYTSLTTLKHSIKLFRQAIGEIPTAARGDVSYIALDQSSEESLTRTSGIAERPTTASITQMRQGLITAPTA